MDIGKCLHYILASELLELIPEDIERKKISDISITRPRELIPGNTPKPLAMLSDYIHDNGYEVVAIELQVILMSFPVISIESRAPRWLAGRVDFILYSEAEGKHIHQKLTKTLLLIFIIHQV
jgi:hypothetical protein